MVDEGMKVPAIDAKPSIVGFAWLWEAYINLTTCRSGGGMGPGTISWLAVNEYATINEFNNHERYVLHHVVQHLEAKLQKFHKGDSNVSGGNKRTRK